MRGFAMITIAINHMSIMLLHLGLKGKQIPTITTYGFSSSAEIFFLISGYMIGIIYLRRPDPIKNLLSRALMIYRYNCGVYILLMLMSVMLPTMLIVETGLAPTISDPFGSVLKFLFLAQSPDLLDVLNVYVVLLLFSPIILLLSRRSEIASLIFCSVIYAVVQLFPSFNLPGGAPDGDGAWNLNPLAWQFLFFGGMTAANHGAFKKLFDWLGARRHRCVVVLTLFAAVTIAFKLTYREIPPFLWRKESLGIIRIFHVLVVVAALASLIALGRQYLQTWPARLLALCGRQTLNCYAASVPATYMLAGLWIAYGRTYFAYLLCVAAIIGVTLFVASFSERRRWKRANVMATSTAAMHHQGVERR